MNMKLTTAILFGVSWYHLIPFTRITCEMDYNLYTIVQLNTDHQLEYYTTSSYCSNLYQREMMHTNLEAWRMYINHPPRIELYSNPWLGTYELKDKTIIQLAIFLLYSIIGTFLLMQEDFIVKNNDSVSESEQSKVEEPFVEEM